MYFFQSTFSQLSWHGMPHLDKFITLNFIIIIIISLLGSSKNSSNNFSLAFLAKRSPTTTKQKMHGWTLHPEILHHPSLKYYFFCMQCTNSNHACYSLMQCFRFPTPEDSDCSPVVFLTASEALANDTGTKTARTDSCSEHQPFCAAKQTADLSQHMTRSVAVRTCGGVEHTSNGSWVICWVFHCTEIV